MDVDVLLELFTRLMMAASSSAHNCDGVADPGGPDHVRNFEGSGLVFSVDSLMQDCQVALAGDGAALAVRDIVGRAVSEPSKILAELGEPTEAGFQTLHQSDDLTILNFAWAPLMTLLPHDHNDMWAVVGLYSGREDNILWRRTGTTIQASGAQELRDGEVTMLGGSVIHSVINPIQKLTLALHVYGGDFFGPGRSEWDPEQLHERPFDVDASRQLFKDANARFAQGAE